MSEVLMSFYDLYTDLFSFLDHFHLQIAIMFWTTFWLEGLPWEYGISYTSQIATLYNSRPSNVTLDLVLW